MGARKSERVAKLTPMLALAAAAAGRLRPTAPTAAALVREDANTPGGVRPVPAPCPHGRGHLRRLAAGGVTKLLTAGKREALAAEVARLKAMKLTVRSSARARKTASPQAPARPKGPQGRRVRVRKWQGTKWSAWRTFQSTTKAANWLKVSQQSVVTWAQGLHKSAKFQAKYLGADDNLKGERWKHYTSDTKVSDRGRVWNVRLQRKYVPTPCADGYCRLGQRYLHCIVAELFVPQGGRGRHHGTEVDHIDGNRSNNAAVNLQWVTHAQNMQLAAVRRKQQGTQRPRNWGVKKPRKKKGEEWKWFVITQAMANLDTRLAQHVGYNTRWKISSFGRVRDTLGYIRRPNPNEAGYRKVNIKISDEGNKRCFFRLARLVGFLFLRKPRMDRTQIDHIDQNKGNDRKDNLRWATPEEQRANRG